MQLSDFIPHFVMALVGALATSVGLGQWARSKRGRPLLARLKGWSMAVLALFFVAISAGGIYWMVRRILDEPDPRAALTSPWGMLVFGLLVGLPFSLPTIVAFWSDDRAGKRSKRRTAPATRDDRRAFAENLVEQIRDVVGKGGQVDVQAGGEGGRVLLFDGNLDSEQGERLVGALRHEMKDLGFKRVEGKSPAGDWWTKV